MAHNYARKPLASSVAFGNLLLQIISLATIIVGLILEKRHKLVLYGSMMLMAAATVAFWRMKSRKPLLHMLCSRLGGPANFKCFC